MNHKAAENQYEPPATAEETVVDGTRSSRSPAVKVVRGALALFVVYSGVGSLVARIEPDELQAAIAVDVLLSVSIVALFAINSDVRVTGSAALRRLIPAVVLGVACSAVLIGWHCLTVHLRLRAAELHRMSLSQNVDITRSDFRLKTFENTTVFRDSGFLGEEDMP